MLEYHEYCRESCNCNDTTDGLCYVLKMKLECPIKLFIDYAFKNDIDDVD